MIFRLKEHTSEGTRLYTMFKSQSGDGKRLNEESGMMEQLKSVRKVAEYK